jgi:hypothetical protein
MINQTRKRIGGGAGRFTKKNAVRVQGVVSRVAIQKDQIVHCVSQLRRFAKCFVDGDESRVLQFGYNLGRLQELCQDNHPELWWKPIEGFFEKKAWKKLYDHVDLMRRTIGVEFDADVLAKGC